MISEADLNRVREATSIKDLAENLYDIALVPAGASIKALCPLPGHPERTPSFTIDVGRGRYVCYGCGRSGDIFEFVKEMEGVDFREAVFMLAERADLHVSDTDEEEKPRVPTRPLLDALERAEKLFANARHEAVTEFIAERNFDEDKLRSLWGLGYSAPETFKALTSEFSANVLVEAGLARTNNGRLYPFFPPRLIWPIRDQLGRTVAFSARMIHDDDRMPGKYVNSPATPVYHKAKILFGLDKARTHIRASATALICEGQMDAVAFHEAGVTCAVAPCGTAITEHHVRTLANMVGQDGELVVAMDADDAGMKSAVKIMELATMYSVRLTTLDLEGDPEEYRRKHGNEGLAGLFDFRVPLVEALLERIIDRFDLSQPDAKASAARQCSALLAHIHDSALRSSYVQWVGRRMGVTMQDTYEPKKNHARATSLEFEVVRLAYHAPSAFRDAHAFFSERLYENKDIFDIVDEAMWIDDTLSDGQWREQLLAITPDKYASLVTTGLPQAVLESDEGVSLYTQQLLTALSKAAREREARQSAPSDPKEFLTNFPKKKR